MLPIRYGKQPALNRSDVKLFWIVECHLCPESYQRKEKSPKQKKRFFFCLKSQLNYFVIVWKARSTESDEMKTIMFWSHIDIEWWTCDEWIFIALTRTQHIFEHDIVSTLSWNVVAAATTRLETHKMQLHSLIFCHRECRLMRKILRCIAT